MKKMMMLVGAILVSTCGFAGVPTPNTHKHSPLLNSLNAAWKAHQDQSANAHRNDVAMVYGGEDVSLRPVMGSQTISL